MPKTTGLLIGITAILIGIAILATPDLRQWILGIGLVVIGILAILRR